MKKLLGTILALCCATVLLTGCSVEVNGNDDSKPSASPSSFMNYQTAKSKFKHINKLSYFEYVSTDDSSDTNYQLGYYDSDNSIVNKNLDQNHAHWKEIVDLKATDTPYVIKSDNTYYIHRPASQQYNQPPVSGKVTGKHTEN